METPHHPSHMNHDQPSQKRDDKNFGLPGPQWALTEEGHHKIGHKILHIGWIKEQQNMGSEQYSRIKGGKQEKVLMVAVARISYDRGHPDWCKKQRIQMEHSPDQQNKDKSGEMMPESQHSLWQGVLDNICLCCGWIRYAPQELLLAPSNKWHKTMLANARAELHGWHSGWQTHGKQKNELPAPGLPWKIATMHIVTRILMKRYTPPKVHVHSSLSHLFNK